MFKMRSIAHFEFLQISITGVPVVTYKGVVLPFECTHRSF